jgi:hypothetical protein
LAPLASLLCTDLLSHQAGTQHSDQRAKGEGTVCGWAFARRLTLRRGRSTETAAFAKISGDALAQVVFMALSKV